MTSSMCGRVRRDETPMTTSSPGFTMAVEGDILEVRHAGPFELEYLVQVLDRLIAERATQPRMFLLIASGEATTTEARKYATEWLKTSTPLEVAVWGGGVVQRTIAEMFSRGVNLLRPGRIFVSFHATRDDALAWIAGRRTQPPPT